jgi:hypothetical protein
MKKFIAHANMTLDADDVMNIQDYLQDAVGFLLSEVISFDDFCTGTNLEPYHSVVPDMKINFKVGTCWIDSSIGYSPEIVSVDIDPAGATDRIDIVTATAEYVEDNEETRKFIEEVGGEPSEYNDDVKTLYINKIIFHYHKDTEVVPEGEMGVVKIPVLTDTTAIGSGAYEDIRPIKDVATLDDHKNMVPLDHEPDCIFNIHIASDAAIDLSKIAGRELASLEEEINNMFPRESEHNFTYDVDGYLTECTYEDDYVNIDYTLDWDSSLLQTITTEYPDLTMITTVTYSGNDVTKIKTLKEV